MIASGLPDPRRSRSAPRTFLHGTLPDAPMTLPERSRTFADADRTLPRTLPRTLSHRSQTFPERFRTLRQRSGALPDDPRSTLLEAPGAPRAFPDVPRRYPGTFPERSWNAPGRSRSAARRSRTFRGTLPDVPAGASRAFPERSRERFRIGSGAFPERSLNAPRPGTLPSVPGTILERSRSVPGTLPECSRRFPESSWSGPGAERSRNVP